MVFKAGGSQQEMSGFDRSSSRGGGRSFIWQPQRNNLMDLWNAGGRFSNPKRAQRRGRRAAARSNRQLGDAIGALQGLLDPSAQIQTQTDALSAGLGNLFSTQINPAMETSAIAAGGLGGGRQGVAQGVAAGQMANVFQQGVADITANANNQAMNAANMMGPLSMQMMGNSQFGQNSAMDMLGMYAQMLGGPAILDRSFNRSNSYGERESTAEDFSFGFSF